MLARRLYCEHLPFSVNSLAFWAPTSFNWRTFSSLLDLISLSWSSRVRHIFSRFPCWLTLDIFNHWSDLQCIPLFLWLIVICQELHKSILFYLCLSDGLHVAGQVIDLHLVFTLLLLKFLLDSLEVVDLLAQLGDRWVVLLPQAGQSRLMGDVAPGKEGKCT